MKDNNPPTNLEQEFQEALNELRSDTEFYFKAADTTEAKMAIITYLHEALHRLYFVEAKPGVTVVKLFGCPAGKNRCLDGSCSKNCESIEKMDAM